MVLSHKNYILGEIYYNQKWNCHVWSQEIDIIMSADCLRQIQQKIEELDNEIR